MEKHIKICSRDSKLAVIQSELIIDQLCKADKSVTTELVTMKTTGDKILNKTLDKIGGKGLFLKELDEALMENRVDLCVHSLKDVPVEENQKYPIVAYSSRETPYDVIVLKDGLDKLDLSLPVGCSSLRRMLQFKMLYPEANVIPVRGNVQTRLRKLDSGMYGALILAEAGLKRLGLENRISYRFTPEEMVPAAGQGVIAVQGREGEYTELLKSINDNNSEICVKTERLVSKLLDGDCSSPIGAYAITENNKMHLYGFYSEDNISVKADVTGDISDNEILASKLVTMLRYLIDEKRSEL